ncbi:MAG: hypothetical protein ACK46A_14095 [Akkermansiaceae bacterium]|jgi:hypothetical protein|nr:hypothetical protein [Luteolibacter sp.]
MYPPTQASYRNKLILLTAVVTMVITSVVWFGIGAAGYWLMYKEPPSFQILVEHPETVELGEEFEVKVSVENVGSDKVNLANVDFYDDLLDGFDVVSITPKPRSSEKIIGYHSYNLFKNLAPGKTHELTFKLKAKEVGFWSGDVDACNTVQNMVTYYTEIEVVEVPPIEN